MEAIIVKYDEGQLGFIRYTILVTVGDQSWSVVRRFNDFQPLNEAVARAFPHAAHRGAHLPPKKWFGRFNPDFLRERKAQLQGYLDAVTALPGFLEACPYARRFFEVDWHLGGEAGAGRGGAPDGVAVDDRESLEQERVAAILEETSRAFINTSLPLHQVSVEMDPAEVAQQRAKILQRTSGFRGHAPTVAHLACSSTIPTAVAGGGGGAGVIDVLARPARMTLGGQAQVLEKQGLRVADELREARQIRTRDDKELICHLREERAM